MLGIKKQLKLISKQCAPCQRINAIPLQQQLGLLPAAWTVLTPPFFKTGIDYAGPVVLREGATRKPVFMKAYWCLFVCMATRAIHIEICRSLDTEEFIAALKRFTNRRGTPKDIYSDNGLSQKLEEEWKGNYLQSLQARKQWKKERCNIKEKDIVFVKDETIATGRWPLGIITKVFPGKDNLVRTVNVKVRGKEYKRSIHMMVPLLMEDDKETEEEH